MTVAPRPNAIALPLREGSRGRCVGRLLYQARSRPSAGAVPLPGNTAGSAAGATPRWRTSSPWRPRADRRSAAGRGPRTACPAPAPASRRAPCPPATAPPATNATVRGAVIGAAGAVGARGAAELGHHQHDGLPPGVAQARRAAPASPASSWRSGAAEPRACARMRVPAADLQRRHARPVGGGQQPSRPRRPAPEKALRSCAAGSHRAPSSAAGRSRARAGRSRIAGPVTGSCALSAASAGVEIRRPDAAKCCGA